MTGIQFIQDLAIVMLVAGLAGWLFQRIGLSVVVGYLTAGMMIGPKSNLMPLIQGTENIQILSQVGLVFVMFSIGMGLSMRRLRRLGLSILIAAAVGGLLVFNITRLLAVAFGAGETQSLFLAAMLVVSSSAIIGKALSDLGATHRKSAQLALGMTALEDIVAIVALTFLISSIGVGGETTPTMRTFGLFGAFVIFLGVTGLLLVPRWLRYLSLKATGELQTLLVSSMLFLLALLAHRAGYSLALGAFLLGAIVAETPQRGEVERSFEGLRHLFSTVFFVSIGMMIDVRGLFAILPWILLVSVLTIVGRAAATSFSLVLIGNETRESVRAGLALTPLGEFSFIIAQTGIAASVLPTEYYPLAVGISVITSLFCPVLVRHSTSISEFIHKLEPKVVSNGIAFYHRWLARLGTIGKESIFWRLSRRRFVQIGVGVLFVTGLLILANPLYSRILRAVGQHFGFQYGTAILFWGATAVIILIPLLAVWRNIGALAMLYAQMTSRGREKETIAPFLIENGIKLVSGLVLFLWLSGFVPLGATGVWGLLLVVALVLLVLLFFRRRIIRIHSQFEVELEELLGTNKSATKSLPPWLNRHRDWDLNVSDFELPALAECAGKKIGDIALRSTFGCSIIAIDRQGFFIGNPNPETVLFPHDRLLLLGRDEPMAKARSFLAQTRDGETLGLDEVQMETVTVPEGSPRLNQTLAELDIARQTGVQVAAIKRLSEPRVDPGPNVRLKAGDELLVAGTPDQVRDFLRWLAAPPALEGE